MTDDDLMFSEWIHAQCRVASTYAQWMSWLMDRPVDTEDLSFIHLSVHPARFCGGWRLSLSVSSGRNAL